MAVSLVFAVAWSFGRCRIYESAFSIPIFSGPLGDDPNIRDGVS